MFIQSSGKKEELLKSLLDKIDKLGRAPSFSEVKDDPKMPDPNDYAYFFTSFTDAVKEAWGKYNYDKGTNKKTSITIKKPIKH